LEELQTTGQEDYDVLRTKTQASYRLLLVVVLWAENRTVGEWAAAAEYEQRLVENANVL
jgi:heme-degrading monooxygenase HmoA